MASEGAPTYYALYRRIEGHWGAAEFLIGLFDDKNGAKNAMDEATKEIRVLLNADMVMRQTKDTVAPMGMKVQGFLGGVLGVTNIGHRFAPIQPQGSLLMPPQKKLITLQ